MSMWLTTFLSVVVYATTAFADVTVFSVNKALSLSDKDPIFKDYYIDGGLQEGFRRGMLVTAVRKVPVHDLSRNRSLGDIHVPVAKLKLIYVNKSISVARVDKLIKPTNLPTTEFAAVMVGDTIVLGDGLEGLGRMDSMEDGDEGSQEGDAQPTAEKSTEKIPASEKPTTDKTETERPEKKAETASLQVTPSEAQKTELEPAPVEVLPEKNAVKPDTQTHQPSSGPQKKTSAKASNGGKKPLKTPAKPDSSSEHAVVGPAA